MKELNEAERQLLMATAYLPKRYGLLMRWPRDTPADQKHLHKFGQYWFGDYLQSWEEAYQTLQEQGLLLESQSTYSLTDKGVSALEELSPHTSMTWYEYNLYYTRAQHSQAHREFCRQTYGEDLQQHGLTDIPQLNILLEQLALQPHQHVLDAGCGSGRITSWLQAKTEANFWGVDLSEAGIKEAQALQRPGLHFSVDNLINLSLPEHFFDTILSIDTIYYVDDINELLQQFLKVLKPQGQIAIFCNNWIWQAEDKGELAPNGSILAQALKQARLPYRWIDLSAAGDAHWKI